jgi:hypothetical protein
VWGSASHRRAACGTTLTPPQRASVRLGRPRVAITPEYRHSRNELTSQDTSCARRNISRLERQRDASGSCARPRALRVHRLPPAHTEREWARSEGRDRQASKRRCRADRSQGHHRNRNRAVRGRARAAVYLMVQGIVRGCTTPRRSWRTGSSAATPAASTMRGPSDRGRAEDQKAGTLALQASWGGARDRSE